MKQLAFILLILLSAKIVFGQYTPVDQGSELKFTIGNLGFDVTGKFTGLQGNIYFDPLNLSTDSFDVSLDANTVNTDNSMRDGHLRGETYFDVKKYPRIHFVSSKIMSGKKNGTYIVTGRLTIKDISKEIFFPFTASPSEGGYKFTGTFRINRKDFDIGGTSTISNELEVSLNVLAKKM